MSTYEDEILRIDLQIQGLKKIRSVPIELGGVRSFQIDYKQQENNLFGESELTLGMETEFRESY